MTTPTQDDEFIPNRPPSVAFLASIQLQAVIPQGRPDATREALDIPLDVDLFKLTLGSPLPWKAYTFDLVATSPAPETTRRWWYLTEREIPALAAYGVFFIVIWQRRVYSAEHAGMWLEIRWHPDKDESVVMAWPRSMPMVPRAKAERAMRLRLEALPMPGRPPGKGTYTAEEFLAVLRPALARVRANGKYRSAATVAKEFPGKVAGRQVARWVQDLLGYSWSELLRQTEDLTTHL
jgi:hypothetical protein